MLKNDHSSGNVSLISYLSIRWISDTSQGSQNGQNRPSRILKLCLLRNELFWYKHIDNNFLGGSDSSYAPWVINLKKMYSEMTSGIAPLKHHNTNINPMIPILKINVENSNNLWRKST